MLVASIKHISWPHGIYVEVKMSFCFDTHSDAAWEPRRMHKRYSLVTKICFYCTWSKYIALFN